MSLIWAETGFKLVTEDSRNLQPLNTHQTYPAFCSGDDEVSKWCDKLMKKIGKSAKTIVKKNYTLKLVKIFNGNVDCWYPVIPKSIVFWALQLAQTIFLASNHNYGCRVWYVIVPRTSWQQDKKSKLTQPLAKNQSNWACFFAGVTQNEDHQRVKHCWKAMGHAVLMVQPNWWFCNPTSRLNLRMALERYSSSFETSTRKLVISISVSLKSFLFLNWGLPLPLV